MKTYKNLYYQIYKWNNLILAYKKARKGKTRKKYVLEFEKNLRKNLQQLQFELMALAYKPKPLKTFTLRDPKTRKISKSNFRDRIIHHALCNIIEPIFERGFIYDSCANQKGKGNLFAVNRLYQFMRKVSRSGKIKGWFNNNQIKGHCLKADIKHYFQEVNHKILIKILKKKINDKNTMNLISKILKNSHKTRGMPLGNLTSQFFANVYLNELDRFVKHKLRIKYYIRYVDDFIILHNSKKQLKQWRKEIDKFLKQKLKLELHPDKSRLIPLSQGIDFVGFRNFYYFKLLRQRSIRKMKNKIQSFNNNHYTQDEIQEIFQGWQAYAKWADTYKLRNNILLSSALGINFLLHNS